jgi:RHS repeat-associated protein
LTIFAGQYSDPESGLIYAINRYYDPSTAQWLTRDPLTAMTGAPYSYVDNNPLNDTDPTGMFSLRKWWHHHWKQVAIGLIVAGAAVATGGVALEAYEASQLIAEGVSATEMFTTLAAGAGSTLVTAGVLTGLSGYWIYTSGSHRHRQHSLGPYGPSQDSMYTC